MAHLGEFVFAGYLWAISSTTFDVHRVLRTLPWMYYPGTMLGPWLVTGTVATLCLTGRPKFIASTVFLVPFSIVVVAIVSDYLPHEPKELLKQSLIVVVSIAVLFGTPFLFAVAYSRELVSKPAAWVVMVWLAMVAIIVLLEFQRAGVMGLLLISAGLALTILPLAGAPLAISVNRHR